VEKIPNNKMKNIILFLLLISFPSYPQNARFVTSGKIDYEFSINTHYRIKKIIGENTNNQIQVMFGDYKKNNPQFINIKTTMSFAQNKTLFKPSTDTIQTSYSFNQIPLFAFYNIIWNDFKTKNTISQKNVYGETYLIRDKIDKIKWKLTDETREIAGYHCKRANGLMPDSTYVVAFYTNQIMVPGGPESFSGLPGMILGVALPHEGMTWFATKITDADIPGNNLNPPKNGVEVNLEEFRSRITKAANELSNYAKTSYRMYFF
jgi:GLPGLI family protein